MQNCHLRSTGAFSPLVCAPVVVNRRALVQCQSSKSANEYSSLDKSEVKKELRTRGLSISGGREQLIHRLHLSDAPPPPPVPAPPTTAAPVVAETEIKEEKPASVKKPRAVRKKKIAAPVTTSNDDALLASPSDTLINEQEAETAEQQLNETTLLKLAKGELQAMAIARGLAKSGTKAQIAARILNVEFGAGVGAAASVELPKSIPSAVAAPKQRAPRKKTSTLKKISTKSSSRTATSMEPITPPSPLRLSESAALKRDAALAAAVTDTTAINSKRRVLATMEESIAVAVTAAAAQNLKWQQEAERKKQKIEEEEEKIASSFSAAAAPVAVSERRRLSPDEAAKVLEEVVRRKGTGGVGLGTGEGGSSGNGSGSSADVVVSERFRKQAEVFSEVDSMKTVMAGFRSRMNAQEESTEQLRASMQKNSDDTARAVVLAVRDAVQVQQELKMVDKVVDTDGVEAFSMVDKQEEQRAPTSPLTTTAKASSDEKRQLQSAIDFALTLGKAMTVLGRGLINSVMKKIRIDKNSF